jgi:hypothetical protein
MGLDRGMKLILENWREYLKEEPQVYDFERDLLEEGLIDLIKDKASAAKALKDEKWNQALKMIINVSQKIEDTSISVQAAINKHIPKPLQALAAAALVAFFVNAGNPGLASKIATRSVTIDDIQSHLATLTENKEKDNETPI